MYHELTKQEIRRRTRKRMAGLLAIVLVVVLVWLSSNAVSYTHLTLPTTPYV